MTIPNFCVCSTNVTNFRATQPRRLTAGVLRLISIRNRRCTDMRRNGGHADQVPRERDGNELVARQIARVTINKRRERIASLCLVSIATIGRNFTKRPGLTVGRKLRLLNLKLWSSLNLFRALCAPTVSIRLRLWPLCLRLIASTLVQ